MDLYTEHYGNKYAASCQDTVDYMVRTSVDTFTLPSFKVSTPSKVGYAFGVLPTRRFACPGATDECEPVCYGSNGRFWFPEVKELLAGNWIRLKWYEAAYRAGDDGAVARCARDLALNVVPARTRIFRLYEDGDLHSQFAVKVMADLARMRPNVRFWLYTRSFMLDLDELHVSPNLMLHLSADKANRDEAEALAALKGYKLAYGPIECVEGPGGLKYATETVPKNTVICPATSGRLDTVKACVKCMLCVVEGRTPKNIGFLRH